MTITLYTQETAPHLPIWGLFPKMMSATHGADGLSCELCREHFQGLRQQGCAYATCAACNWDRPDVVAHRNKMMIQVRKIRSGKMAPMPNHSLPPLFTKGFDPSAVVIEDRPGVVWHGWKAMVSRRLSS
jgi:hypothetical protein